MIRMPCGPGPRQAVDLETKQDSLLMVVCHGQILPMRFLFDWGGAVAFVFLQRVTVALNSLLQRGQAVPGLHCYEMKLRR